MWSGPSPHWLEEIRNYSLKQALDNMASASSLNSCIALPPATLVSLFTTHQALFGFRAFALAVPCTSNTPSLFFLWLLPHWALQPTPPPQRGLLSPPCLILSQELGISPSLGGHGCATALETPAVWFGSLADQACGREQVPYPLRLRCPQTGLTLIGLCGSDKT